MTHELILTSVAQGLDSEGGGFCVVAADSCFPESLVENLFQISDYRYHLPIDSDDVNQNPVIYSHTIIKPSNTTPPTPSKLNKKNNNSSSSSVWHVLSRIAPSGKDYRNKPNRLAHHIVLSEEELVIEGPAWLLALSGFHFTQWYTPPMSFPSGRPIPTISLYGIPPQTCRQKIARERLCLDPNKTLIYPHKPNNAETTRKIIQSNESQITSTDFPTSPCPTWEEVMGDAGWGGVLAESIRNKKETAIIYPQGMNLLPLFVEAFAIVPAQFMWDATFTTYYINPANNNDDSNKPEINKSFRHSQTNRQKQQLTNMPYLLRGVLAETPEADKLKKRSDILVIDLTRKPVEQPEGIFVKFAITGAEDDLFVETDYPQNDNIDDLNNGTNNDDPQTTQNFNVEFPQTTTVLATDGSQIESDVNLTDDVKTTEQSDEDDNLKFVPNAEPDNLSFTVPQTSTPEQVHLPPPIPNILVKKPTDTQNKITTPQQKSNKLLNRLLLSLSKNQFYITYIIAMVIIVGLLLLVIDQITGFGTMQSLFTKNNTSIQTVDPPIEIVNDPNGINKPDDNKTEQKTAEQIKAEQQKKLEAVLLAINKKRKTDVIELDRYIREFDFPPFLPLKPPTIKENVIVVPKNYSIFTGFSGLHRYGLALRLDWVSLWDFGDKKIVTRRLKFNIGDPIDPENIADQDQENNNENESDLSNVSKKQLRYRLVNLQEIENPVAENNQIALPDPNRFEWEVVAIIQDKKNVIDNVDNNIDINNNTPETENKIVEVKLFHIKLKENGLYIKWERSGLLPEHFYDTLRVSLGFLRFTVEDAAVEDNVDNKLDLLDENIRNDNSNLESDQFEHFVQLFEPQSVSSISPSIVFADKKTQFVVPTPFSVTPWDSLFSNSDQFDYKLDLNVHVQPKLIADILTEVKKTRQTESTEIEFTTKKVEAKRKKPDGINAAEEYFPLQVKFIATADMKTIVWTDFFDTELEILQKKLEAATSETQQVKDDLRKTQQKLFGVANAPNKTDERKELENKKTELEKKERELTNYEFEASSVIKNLPEAHKTIINNNEIQFDYSVYLTSGENKRALLIMSTSNKLINERINKKKLK
ncbi:MAG: hypothetical protein LBH59_11740 [Planctomycetaceae bacterium]|jgi:hypothetical protein|nr:hypothetical protein [Planctomycetaceae bacterium]